MSRQLTVGLLVAAAMLAPLTARAQLSPGTGTAVLRGSVLDDGDDHRLGGATVSIENLRLTVLTDSAGNFTLRGIPAGRHIVIAKRLGYQPVSSVLAFSQRDTVEADFALIKSVPSLPRVDVKTSAPLPPRLSEFGERRKMGIGSFLGPEDFIKNKDRRMSEILVAVPNVNVTRGIGSYGWVTSRMGYSSGQRFELSQADLRRGAERNLCYAAVMLDGSYVFSGQPGELLFDVNSLSPSSVQAAEYYRDAASIPAKYNRMQGQTCGLLILWTK